MLGNTNNDKVVPSPYDQGVLRLYESNPGEKGKEIGTRPNVSAANSVNIDSRGYVLMEGCAKQADTKESSVSEQQSSDGTARYMNMNEQKPNVHSTLTTEEQEDEVNPPTCSHYVNLPPASRKPCHSETNV